MTSGQQSHRSDEYTLTWETVSLLRIEEYRILYRAVAGVTPFNIDRVHSFGSDKKSVKRQRKGGEWTTSIIQEANNRVSMMRLLEIFILL